MRISVITVNYNNISGLRLTIDSVLNQILDSNYELEYIVIDGGSTDSSVDLLRIYDKQIYFWVSEKDRGIYHAMNKGIIKSTGQYLVFLNSGDYFIDNSVLIKCHEYLVSSKGVDVYYGDTLIVTPQAHNVVRHIHPNELSLSFFRQDTINHQASLINRNLFNEFGLYPEQYRLASDYWLYLVAFIKGKVYKYIDSPLVYYNTDGMSSFANFEEYKKEKESVWNKLFDDLGNSYMLTKEIDKLLMDNRALRSILSRKSIQMIIWLDDKMRKIKRAIKS